MQKPTIVAFAVLVVVGCVAKPDVNPPTAPAWAQRLVDADPVWGSGRFFVDRLELYLHGRTLEGRKPASETGDPAVRADFYAATKKTNACRAAALARATVDEATANAALQFLRSAAGQSFVAAQEFSLANMPWQGHHFPTETAAAYGDPKQVGEAARQRVYGPGGLAQQGANRPGSISPLTLSRVIGGMRISAEHAKVIRKFFQSQVGQRYLQAQLQAFALSSGRYQEFRDEAIGLGLIDQTKEEQQPLLLPLTAAEPGDKPPALRPIINVKSLKSLPFETYVEPADKALTSRPTNRTPSK